MDAWEANLVLNLRLWCEGSKGQSQVWQEYRASLQSDEAQRECRTFEALLQILLSAAHRPLVRHDVGCACVGSDESIFIHLVRTASAGHLRDAALIATLMVGPAYAEQLALLAGHVGGCARKIHGHTPEHATQMSHRDVLLH